MDQPYSFWADALSKFHTSSEWIQALWLVTVPVTVVGAIACIMWGISQIVAVVRRSRGTGRDP